MTGRRIAVLTVAAATTAFVLSGRQRRQRGQPTRGATATPQHRPLGHRRQRLNRHR